jgi:Domain of unknown function (DUF4160)
MLALMPGKPEARGGLCSPDGDTRAALPLSKKAESIPAREPKASISWVQSLHYNACMPTLARLAKSKIAVYADDHNPPHFHVLAHDGHEAWVELATLLVIWGSVDRAALKEALAWASQNAPLLAEKWKELNP